MKGLFRYLAIPVVTASLLACNLSSSLFIPNPTSAAQTPSGEPASSSSEMAEPSATPASAVQAAGAEAPLDICTLVTKNDVEKFFAEPASDPKGTPGGCTFTNVKDSLYAFSIGAAQDKETVSILQGQAMLLGLAGIQLNEAVQARIKPLADALDYKGYLTELVALSKSSDTIKAKLFAGGGNDLAYWAWITVPPRRTGAFVAVRGTTLVSLYLVVPESQSEETMLNTSNILAGEVFKKLPQKFTISPVANPAGSQNQPPSVQATPTLVGGAAGQTERQAGTSGEATPTLVGQSAGSPLLLSPQDGTEFNIFPRTITLTWSPVPGVSRYLVEIMACSATNPENCFSHPMIEQTTRETTKTSYTFDFVGKQPGKWRVFPLGADGKLGNPSPWWKFTCLQ